MDLEDCEKEYFRKRLEIMEAQGGIEKGEAERYIEIEYDLR